MPRVQKSRTYRELERLLPLEEELETAREAFLLRLFITACWIEAILAKKYPPGCSDPEEKKEIPELQWLSAIRNPEAEFSFVTTAHAQRGFSVQVSVPEKVADGWSGRKKTKLKTYQIHDVFVEGNMWECCKLTRRFIYAHKYRKALETSRTIQREMQSAERAYSSSVRRAERSHKEKIEQLELKERQAHNSSERWLEIAQKYDIGK